MNIYQRINEIKKEIKYIKKDTKVTGAGSYNALSHDMVTASTRELFVKHGVVSIPSLKEKTWTEGRDKGEGKTGQGRYDAVYTVKFINIEDPADCFSIEVGAQGMDSQDKAPGKTISMAKKIAVLKVLDLESGDAEESRIKEDVEFDLEFHSKLILEAEDRETAVKFYLEAKKIATDAKDSQGVKEIEKIGASLKTKFGKA